jgi:hypothetical protein
MLINQIIVNKSQNCLYLHFFICKIFCIQEMKAYAKTILQEEYESRSKSQVSPKVKQQRVPQQQRPSPTPPRQNGVGPASGQLPQSAKRLSMSPAASTNSIPSPRVKPAPPGLYDVVSCYSPELKAQVSFSDRLLSGVHLSVSVNIYIFDFFSRTA